jgi:hypothetical protein
MMRGAGVSAEGIRAARADSIWRRIAEAADMAILSPNIRLFQRSLQVVPASKFVQSRAKPMKIQPFILFVG